MQRNGFGSPASTVNKGTGNDRQLFTTLQVAKEKAKDDGEDAVGVVRLHAQQVDNPDRGAPFSLMNEAVRLEANLTVQVERSEKKRPSVIYNEKPNDTSDTSAMAVFSSCWDRYSYGGACGGQAHHSFRAVVVCAHCVQWVG